MGITKFIRPAEEKTHDITEEATTFEQRRQKCVLLVEDEVEYGEMLKEHLGLSGYSVTIAHDGVQGMRKVIEKDYDAIICDLLMPNLPGDMFYRGVERVKPHLLKKFVFITGHQSDPKVAEFLKQVRCLMLFKPFPMNMLLEAVQVVVNKEAKIPASQP